MHRCMPDGAGIGVVMHGAPWTSLDMMCTRIEDITIHILVDVIITRRRPGPGPALAVQLARAEPRFARLL